MNLVYRYKSAPGIDAATGPVSTSRDSHVDATYCTKHTKQRFSRRRLPDPLENHLGLEDVDTLHPKILLDSTTWYGLYRRTLSPEQKPDLLENHLGLEDVDT